MVAWPILSSVGAVIAGRSSLGIVRISLLDASLPSEGVLASISDWHIEVLLHSWKHSGIINSQIGR